MESNQRGNNQSLQLSPSSNQEIFVQGAPKNTFYSKGKYALAALAIVVAAVLLIFFFGAITDQKSFSATFTAKWNADENLELIEGKAGRRNPHSVIQRNSTQDGFYSVAVETYLMLREGPSTDAQIVARLGNGVVVQVIDKCLDDWAYVYVKTEGDELRGYVSSRFLVPIVEVYNLESVATTNE